MTVVKINALTCAPDDQAELVSRFQAAGSAIPQDVAGFEGYEMLVPDDRRDTVLVITRWASDADFQAWISSPDFAERHRRHREGGRPVATGSQIWSFSIVG